MLLCRKEFLETDNIKRRLDTHGPRFENEAYDFPFGLILRTRVKETQPTRTYVTLEAPEAGVSRPRYKKEAKFNSEMNCRTLLTMDAPQWHHSEVS